MIFDIVQQCLNPTDRITRDLDIFHRIMNMLTKMPNFNMSSEEGRCVQQLLGETMEGYNDQVIILLVTCCQSLALENALTDRIWN